MIFIKVKKGYLLQQKQKLFLLLKNIFNVTGREGWPYCTFNFSIAPFATKTFDLNS